MAGDVPAIAEVLADAFVGSPWTRWTVDSTDHRARIESLQELALRELVLPYGEAWVHDDPASGVVSASLWMLPGTTVPPDVAERAAARAADLEGDRHAASLDAEAQLESLRPTVPCRYLGAVGTRPDQQGAGRATGVLRPALQHARRHGEVVSLETSTERNVRFYVRLGFTVSHHLRLRGGGPDVWIMTMTPDAEG